MSNQKHEGEPQGEGRIEIKGGVESSTALSDMVARTMVVYFKGLASPLKLAQVAEDQGRPKMAGAYRKIAEKSKPPTTTPSTST